MPDSRLGERVRSLRDRLRLTQQQLGDKLGVSRQTIWNWEHGASQVPSADLPQLASALGVSVAQLYDNSSPRRDVDSAFNRVPFNVTGRRDELREVGVVPIPIYRWGSLGDPRDRESAPFPDRMDYPPLGRERLVGPNGFGVDVQGESMEGRDIRDGDTCWINPDKAYRLGDVVLASVSDGNGEGGMVVKTFARTEVGDCLVSETATGKSTVVCREFHIIGPVVLISPRPFPPR